MITPKVLNLILALQVLTTLIMYVNTLPITSKPIENTAENLAWQAWLMLPPEQKNLEKSRKVTPKSIFTLPFRDCPPGHQLFENRCIPTVQIDPTALLTQEILGFVDGSADINYEEFDYDDFGEGEIKAEVMYDITKKLNGNDDSYNDTYEQLPTQDEPLKFNIFQQKFPTDYTDNSMASVMTTSDEQQQQQQQAERDVQILEKSNNNSTVKPLAEAVNALASTDPSQNSKQNSTQNANNDLQMESSNVSTNIVENEADANTGIVTPTTFSLSDIDAIILSATSHSNNNNNDDDEQAVDPETKKQKLHKVSLFKDDSSVQLVTTSLLDELNNKNNENKNKQPDFTQLLKADDLLPLPNIAAASDKTASTRTTMTVRKANTDNEVPTLSTSFMSSSSVISLSSHSVNDEVTDVEATMPTLLSDLPEKTVDAENIEIEMAMETKKAEHPRSVVVTDNNNETDAQELSFVTTTEADATTNFQLDETTIVETHDAPTIALKELLDLEASRHTKTDNDDDDGTSVVKKSKVEAVELPPVEPTLMPTGIKTEITTAKMINEISADTSIEPTTLMTPETTTPSLKTASTTSTKTTDRFDDNKNNKQQQMSTKTGEDDKSSDNSDRHNFRNAETTTTTSKLKTTEETTTMTAKTSEIDIEQELRMINESVKGDSSSETNKSLTTTTTSSSAIDEAESGLTTTTSAAASALTSNQIKILNKEESSLSTTDSTAFTVTLDNSTPSPETTTELTSTSTIWSKIMPLLGFANHNSDATDDSKSTTVQSLEDTSTTPVSINAATPSKSSDSSDLNINNRSNRNSKIIRINSLSSFSSSKYSKSPNTNHHDNNNKPNSIKVTDKLSISSTQATLITTTTIPTTTTVVEISNPILTTTDLTDDSSSNSQISDIESTQPFWWLPIGWRLDRSNEPSLLLRLWSALPGQGQ